MRKNIEQYTDTFFRFFSVFFGYLDQCYYKHELKQDRKIRRRWISSISKINSPSPLCSNKLRVERNIFGRRNGFIYTQRSISTQCLKLILLNILPWKNNYDLTNIFTQIVDTIYCSRIVCVTTLS